MDRRRSGSDKRNVFCAGYGGIGAFDSCYINEKDASLLPEGITPVSYIFAGHHDYPSSSEYIQYTYEDAVAYLNGELTGTPMTMMGAESMLYQGEHVSFLLDQ